MRKSREILRLKYALGLSNRQIAASLHLSHTRTEDPLLRLVPTSPALLESGGCHVFTWPIPPSPAQSDAHGIAMPASKTAIALLEFGRLLDKQDLVVACQIIFGIGAALCHLIRHWLGRDPGDR
jgi:hypothetical protein